MYLSKIVSYLAKIYLVKDNYCYKSNNDFKTCLFYWGIIKLSKNYRKNRSKKIQFTYKQHFIGRQFLKKFTDENNKIEIIMKDTNKKIIKSPNDKIFCGYKRWNEIGERLITNIENDFMKEIQQCLEKGVVKNTDIINRYYVAWITRGHLVQNSLEDQIPSMPKCTVSIEEHLTHEQQDILEHNGFFLF